MDFFVRKKKKKKKKKRGRCSREVAVSRGWTVVKTEGGIKRLYKAAT